MTQRVRLAHKLIQSLLPLVNHSLTSGTHLRRSRYHRLSAGPDYSPEKAHGATNKQMRQQVNAGRHFFRSLNIRIVAEHCQFIFVVSLLPRL